MKILLIMDPGIPVPPTLYGGIERIVYLLAEEYIKLGHEVTLLAGPDSHCSGTTVHFGANDLSRPKNVIRKEVLFVWRFLRFHKGEFDLMHNFGRLIYLLPILRHNVKKIMSYQRPVTNRNIKITQLLGGKHLTFTACSNYCVSTGDVAGNWATIYNAVDFTMYRATAQVAADAPLIFLGRLDEIKGAHHAIHVAKVTNHKLIIAGNIPDTADNLKYFKEQLEPQFDGQQIIYIGAVNDAQKNELLGKAKTLLFPIEWDEPFGIVMIEAMACGTPVIGFKRGSVPEVIDDGLTGFITTNREDMVKAVGRLDAIDRRKCRDMAERRFNIREIAQQYLGLVNTSF